MNISTGNGVVKAYVASSFIQLASVDTGATIRKGPWMPLPQRCAKSEAVCTVYTVLSNR